MKKIICSIAIAIFLSVAAVPVNASEDKITKEQLYELFKEVIMNAEAKYGEPQKYDVDDGASMLDGVCFAKLVDFNKDGLEELILVYETNEAAYRLGNFKFEIWCYNGDNLTIADSGELYGTDGGTKTLCITEYNGNTYIISGMGDDFDYQYYHGYGENGFGIIREATYEWCPDTDNMIYTIDGYDVSEGQWTAEQDVWRADASFYMMNQRASADAIKEYKDTKRQLGFNISANELNILNSDYILPNSATEYITVEQLVTMNLSEKQLILARNEIFARRGRTFNTSEIQQYFDSKAWYTPQYTPEEFDSLMYDILNNIELANIDAIKMVEGGSNEKERVDYKNEVVQHSELEKDLFWFITSDSYQYLIKHDNYSYMKFVPDFRSNILDQYLVDMIDLLIETGSEPGVNEYIKALVNIITIYDKENAESIAEQKKLDNLKNYKDYAIDIVEMGTQAVSVYSGLSATDSKLEKGIITAIDSLSTIKDNAENWLDAFTNLETVLQDYSKYDSFLRLIEENSKGNLKEAANIMRNSMRDSVNIKLKAYENVTDKNWDNYTKFFFDDIFFEVAKKTNEYKNEDTFRFFVDESESFYENVNILLDSWKLGLSIGKLIGNIAVGGENLIKRILEMEALYDISRILQVEILSNVDPFLKYYYGDSDKNESAELADTLNFLIATRQRGEYCIFSILASDAGLLSWYNYKNDDELIEWYNLKIEIFAETKNLVPVFNYNQESIDESIQSISSLQIINNIKRTSYIGNQKYPLTVYWENDDYSGHPAISTVNQTGIMAVLKVDFDDDGVDEILSLSLEQSSHATKVNSIYITILKYNENKWSILTEAEIIGQDWQGNYYDVSCMQGKTSYYEGSIFLRKNNGKYEIFFEKYEEGMFVTGQCWLMKGFRFEDNKLILIPETENIFYEGSPIDELWTLPFDELRQYNEGAVSMLENYCSLGFVRPYISFGQMTVNQNSSLYEILRLRLYSDLSREEVMSFCQNHDEVLGSFWYAIEDYSENIPQFVVGGNQ